MTASDGVPGTEAQAAPRLGVDWGAALRRHERMLRVAVLARVGEPQAVDEVMQEVALAAVAARGREPEAARIAAWLYRLAVRQSLLYRRRCGRSRKLNDRYAERIAPDAARRTEAGDPLGWLLDDERGRLVRAALGRLPPRDAEILMWKYGENWTYREMAEHLGVGESAVEARLHRARRRLRELMSPHADDETAR